MNLYTEQALPGATVSSSGPLGSFTGPGASFVFPAFVWDDQYGDVIIAPTDDASLVFGFPPTQLYGAQVYTCFTITCATDFGRGSAEGLPQHDIPTVASLHYTTTAVPEGSTLSYLLGGLGLGLLATLASTSRERPV